MLLTPDDTFGVSSIIHQSSDGCFGKMFTMDVGVGYFLLHSVLLCLLHTHYILHFGG